MSVGGGGDTIIIIIVNINISIGATRFPVCSGATKWRAALLKERRQGDGRSATPHGGCAYPPARQRR